ncbi:MAG: PadR family transcriptional regulator [Candidatus Hadarchaeaceae archaeon]
MVLADSNMLVSSQGEVVFSSLVKCELECVILALLLCKPMSGTDIIKTVHEKFGLLLSPGTVYPLLHNLERKGLVQCKRRGKVKAYRHVKRKEINRILESHVSAMKWIIDFLCSAMDQVDII